MTAGRYRRSSFLPILPSVADLPQTLWLRLVDLGICGVALICQMVVTYWSLRDIKLELVRLREVLSKLPVRFQDVESR